MGEPIDLTQGELDYILEKRRLARLDQQELSDRRKANWSGYCRRPFGNENPNRSTYVAGDVFSQVETCYPMIMRPAISASQKMTVQGPDPMIAKALKVKCQNYMRDQDAFNLFATVIKGGLINLTGTAKVWWARKFKKVQQQMAVPQSEVPRIQAAMDSGRITAFDIQAIQPGTDGVVTSPDGADVQPFSLEGQVMATVTVLELETSGPMIVAVPPEEMLFERGKASINDRKGCGLQRTMTFGEILRMQDQLSLPGQPFFRNLQLALDKAPTGPHSGVNDQARDEREAREALHFSTSSPYGVESTTEQNRRQVEFLEWIDYVQVGGEEVWAKLWILGDTCIRAERNEEGIVPYPTWTPHPVPHLIHGISVAEEHLHEYKMRSLLARGVMDQVGFALDREVYTTAGADVLGLRNRYPGKLINGKPGADFEFGEPPVIDARIYQAMAWLSAESQTTGPGNPLMWGGSPDEREKTATGASLRTRASLTKIDLVAMAFIEQFIVDLTNKLIYLMQNNLDKPTPVTVDGQVIVLTREMIQGPYICSSDFGLDVDFDDSEFRKAMALDAAMMASYQQFPMLYPLKAVYESKKAVILASGERSAGERIAPPPPGAEGWFIGMQLPVGGPAGPGGPPVPAGGPTAAASPAGHLPGGNRPGGPGPLAGMAPLSSQVTQMRDNAVGEGSAQPDQTRMGGAT